MIQRRQFLAAAAALAVLPQTANADSPAPHEIVEDRSVMDDRTKSLTDCGSVPGSLNNVHVTADMNGGPFKVEEVHEEGDWSGVGLRWMSGSIGSWHRTRTRRRLRPRRSASGRRRYSGGGFDD